MAYSLDTNGVKNRFFSELSGFLISPESRAMDPFLDFMLLLRWIMLIMFSVFAWIKSHQDFIIGIIFPMLVSLCSESTYSSGGQYCSKRCMMFDYDMVDEMI